MFFSSLQSLCDDQHQHAKWNPVQQGSSLQFPTAEEAAYPHLLCKRVAAVLQQYAIANCALLVTLWENRFQPRRQRHTDGFWICSQREKN